MINKDAPHIDPKRLLACAQQDQGPDQPDVAAHLRHCDACAGFYARALLQSGVTKAEAPDDIWRHVQARLLGPCAAGSRPRPWRALVLATGLLLAISVVFLARWVGTGTLDVGHYLDALEQTAARPNVENLRRNFAGFVASTGSDTLQQASVRSGVADYRLVSQRVMNRFTSRTIQLLYDSGTDSFAVFVAPRTAALDFGKYHLVGADLGAIRCRRAECPRQDVYLVATDKRQYVFIHKHDTAVQSDRLLAELLAPPAQ